MVEFFGLLCTSIVIESVIDICNDLFAGGRIAWQKVTSIILGITVAIGFNLDLFFMFGLTASVPFLGMILTGIVLPRGANYVSDIIKKINGFRNTENDLEQ